MTVLELFKLDVNSSISQLWHWTSQIGSHVKVTARL